MNKEKLQKLMKEVDKTNKPKHWKKFIKRYLQTRIFFNWTEDLY